jgi:aldose 1-epimerase
VCILNHGGAIRSLEVPDRDGVLADVVLGCDTAAAYADSPYFGAVIGRFANRIKGGAFSVDGVDYTLAQNNGPNALHGGERGFDKVVWDAEVLDRENAVRMTYLSADGEEGFPGEVKTVVTYTLTEENELKIDYRAESSKATPFNITNHSYFNLAGHDAGSCLDQIVELVADTFLPTDETAIPFGDECPVAGTPFDFLAPHSLGERIDEKNEQLTFAAGYDHNFCLKKDVAGALSLAARATDPVSGRVMETYTTEPGVQLYTGNWIPDGFSGKGGALYGPRHGFCFETQHYPDSPNQSQFPSVILRPGEQFESQTVYAFSVV